MAKTMRAGVVHAFGKPLTIEEIPIPTPGPGEVLIKVVATGVCHTDLHAAEAIGRQNRRCRLCPVMKVRELSRRAARAWLA